MCELRMKYEMTTTIAVNVIKKQLIKEQPEKNIQA